MTAYNLSSTSVYVTWFPVPEESQNGIIRAYQVLYRNAYDKKSPAKEISVENSTLSVVISDLEKFTVYYIWVKAVTVATGPSSNVLDVITDEDGEIFSCFKKAFFLSALLSLM